MVRPITPPPITTTSAECLVESASFCSIDDCQPPSKDLCLRRSDQFEELCVSLRSSAVSAFNGYFNAENAEERRDTQSL